ncbi:MAG TPA: helix-turn-helix domain-containing protein [Acetobacteraceae bacterium]|nr:helix-turn-helix domain-containing protein [Acetobacteraceae bacterium]
MTESLGIGAVAKATGIKVETVRWYERVGLLPQPERTAGNYRSYGPAHLARLSFIRRARELGFSLDQVRTLLRLADQRDQSCAEVDGIAREHLQVVERKIADLEVLRGELSQLIAFCGQGNIAQCRILQALTPAQAATE